MVSPIAAINMANYRQRALGGGGVTWQPPIRMAPPPRGPVRGRAAAQPGPGSLLQRARNDEAFSEWAQNRPGVNDGGGGGLSGLGWIVGKPLQAGLAALSVLDYPRATVNALLTEGIAEIIQRMPDADKYKALDTDFSWGDIGRNIKEHKGFGETLVEPIMGPEGSDWNIWVRRGLGFAGDLATDPFSYATAGTKALMGAPARAEYANKLLDVTQDVGRNIARNEDIIARVAPTLAQAPPASGYGALAQQMMGRTLGEARQELPELVARQGRLLASPYKRSELSALEQIGRRGVNIANPEQLAAMGIEPHAIRWAGLRVPGTERISRGISRATGPIKGRLSETAAARGLRSLRTPTGEAGQELGRAMERILTGQGGISMERALRTIKLDQWIREGGSTFRAFAARALQQLDDEVAGMTGEEREALMHLAETGGDEAANNIVRQMAPRMVEAAREAGVELPVIEGMEYVPHVLSREAFNFLDRMRAGKNPLVDEFRRRIGITADDLLEEGGFLQRRSFRPELQADGTLKPQKFKIGEQEITINTGSLQELEEKLGGVLRSAGFEGKLYETDPVEAWKRYIISTERDVGKRYSARRGARAGYEGLFERTPGGPEGYDPVGFRDILPREPGGRQRQIAYRKPESAEPKGDDLFEYVTDEGATKTRNERITQKMPRAKKREGYTQREIAEELEDLGTAERRTVAEQLDATAEAAWSPHREEMRSLKKEMSEARSVIRNAEVAGEQGRLQIDQIDDAIAEADREIQRLNSRIGGIKRGAQRKVEVQTDMLVERLSRELDEATAERERMVALYNDAIERADQQLPAAKRRAAIRTENEPIRRERKLFKARRTAKKKLDTDTERARNILRSEAKDPKTGRSTWITQERVNSAQKRLDDPRLQRQYDGLIEERNNIAQERMRVIGEATEHEQRAQEALAKANLSSTSDDEAERLIEFAKEQRRLANAKARIAADMINAHNKVTLDISQHTLHRDRETLRLWNRQEARVDKFNRDVAGGNINVPLRRQQHHQANLELQDFLRQKEHEAAYQAQPPPKTLTEHYERELPKATETLEAPETRTLAESRKRLREVKAELDNNPEPTMRDVTVPDVEPTKRGPGLYEVRVGEGERDRYVIDHVVIPASESPAGYGRVDHWAITYPGEMVPDVAATSRREAMQKVTEHRELLALGEAKRAWRENTAALHAEQEQLTNLIESKPVYAEQVARAERVSKGAAEHTTRQAEMANAQKIIDENGDIVSKINAQADLERAQKAPEPKWDDPETEPRAAFEARHKAWADEQASIRKQLRVVKGQLTKAGNKRNAVVAARKRLAQLQEAEAREFGELATLQRPPFFAELEARNQANIAAAGDLQTQLQNVARQWEPQAAEAIQRERAATAARFEAEAPPMAMRTEGERGYDKPIYGSGTARETAEGVPTTAEGITLRTVRGTPEGELSPMEEIAAVRQRIEEIHANKAINERDREVVEEAQAAWFAPYNQGVENHRVARARYKEIENRAAGLKPPRTAEAAIAGKRGGRPYASQLKLVEPAAKPSKAGGINFAKLAPGADAYEVQPMYRTIEDVNKIIAQNPTGDDQLMLRIEAEIGNHLTQLDKITREYDIPAMQVRQIIKDASNGKLAPVLKRQLREGFEYMWEGGDVIIDKELKAIYFNVSKQLDSKLFGRTFTMLTDFFKTYATLTPGFHVRNALSAIFMNSSEGVAMATQRDAVRLWRQFIEAPDAVAWMRALRKSDPKAADAFRAVFASGAGGQFMERGVSELRSGGVRMSERVFANKVTRLSQRVGANWVEGPQRLALGLHSTREGMSITDAINRITRVHFDYGQVSRFDEKAKRIIPFWTFMSRNVPLQFTQMWAKPRTYLRYQSFVRNMQTGVDEDPWIPEYIKQGGGFDTGLRTPGWLANSPLADIPVLGNLIPPEGMPIVMQPDLPHTRLQEDVRRTSAALGGENPGQILSDVNPFFTAPFEYAMGKDFFTGKEYGADDWSQAGGLGTPLAMLLSPVGGGKRGADGNWYLQDKAMNFLRSIVPPIDRTSRLTPGLLESDPENMDRMLESYVRFLGGPFRTISDEQKRDEQARRYYDQVDRMMELAATGGR